MVIVMEFHIENLKGQQIQLRKLKTISLQSSNILGISTFNAQVLKGSYPI